MELPANSILRLPANACGAGLNPHQFLPLSLQSIAKLYGSGSVIEIGNCLKIEKCEDRVTVFMPQYIFGWPYSMTV